MFCQDMKRHKNPIGAFNQNDVRIWSLFEIIAHGLSNWLIIELHFPVTPAFGYGVVKIDTSNYWMFLHPIVGCTSNYWIKSNSWILAQTDISHVTAGEEDNKLENEIIFNKTGMRGKLKMPEAKPITTQIDYILTNSAFCKISLG